MAKINYDKIIVKFLIKEADQNELEALDRGLKKKLNSSIFNEYVRIDYLISLFMSDHNLDKAKKSISRKVKKAEAKLRIKFYGKIAVAAGVLILIGLSIFNENEEIKSSTVQTGIEVGSSKAILTLENGEEVSLKKGKSFEKGYASSNGEHLIYENHAKQDVPRNKPMYNSLTIPRGGEFFLKLSDGSKVWLNSESKLKYPVSFFTGQPREIELVYGEAYLEVSPSIKHNGASFIVLSGQQKIKVLGTEFNIEAYRDRNEIITTLLGGKIELEVGDAVQELQPNQQAKIENGSDEINIAEVDVSKEIAWVKGLFHFEGKSLDEIMEILSRWYDVDVFFESTKEKNFTFTGILERTKSIEDILRLIETTSAGEITFVTKNRIIIVK